MHFTFSPPKSPVTYSLQSPCFTDDGVSLKRLNNSPKDTWLASRDGRIWSLVDLTPESKQFRSLDCTFNPPNCEYLSFMLQDTNLWYDSLESESSALFILIYFSFYWNNRREIRERRKEGKKKRRKGEWKRKTTSPRLNQFLRILVLISQLYGIFLF